MKKPFVFCCFFLAVFLQSGAYGLTFMLPKLFSAFGANEKDVGMILAVTALSTLLSVYYSGHLTDKLGRLSSLGLSGVSISISLFLMGWADKLDSLVFIASILLGFGWGIFYTLTPVVLTRITAAKERVRIFSLNSIFIMSGFGLSPVMASVLESNGFKISHSFYVVASICFISGVLFFLLISPIRTLSKGALQEFDSSISLKSFSQVMKSRAFVPVFMVCLGASIFAGMSNFQTVFAGDRELNYAHFFLTYTITVIICRILLTGFSGGKSPYLTISFLQYIMFGSIVLFLFSGNSPFLYILVAILFGIGYGASYPILAAMAANDANSDLIAQTLQIFAFTYFIGIFGFPLIAGWVIVELNTKILLISISILALIEATMALNRGRARNNT